MREKRRSGKYENMREITRTQEPTPMRRKQNGQDITGGATISTMFKTLNFREFEADFHAI